MTSFFALPHRQCGNGKVWYGFGSGGQEGSMTTRLSGCGHAILDFGNCWDRRTYKVEVYLNEKRISRANGSTPSKIVGFDFTDGDILKLKEDGAIIKFNKLTIINCKHCTFWFFFNYLIKYSVLHHESSNQKNNNFPQKQRFMCIIIEL